MITMKTLWSLTVLVLQLSPHVAPDPMTRVTLQPDTQTAALCNRITHHFCACGQIPKYLLSFSWGLSGIQSSRLWYLVVVPRGREAGQSLSSRAEERRGTTRGGNLISSGREKDATQASRTLSQGNFPLLKVNMSFLIARQVFIRLIATLLWALTPVRAVCGSDVWMCVLEELIACSVCLLQTGVKERVVCS